MGGNIKACGCPLSKNQRVDDDQLHEPTLHAFEYWDTETIWQKHKENPSCYQNNPNYFYDRKEKWISEIET